MEPCKIIRSILNLALFSLLFFAGIGIPSSAQSQDKTPLKEVKISGNLRVEDDGIRLHLKSRPGDVFDPAIVEQDVKAIFRMGFFDDVQAELSADGVLTYAVKEKPYIREVKIQGAAQVGKDKIETALGVSPRTILDRTKISEGVEKVRRLFNDQGYVNASVDYAVSIEANNQAVVTLDIVEGNRLLIKRVSFEGNKAIPSGELKSLIGTKEEWIFSFLTNRGVLDRDMLTNDVAILSNHYNDNGYVDHKVDDPVLIRGRDGLEVIFRINEGPQYRVGKVEIGGELIDNGQQMLKSVKLTTGQIFRGSRLREDITTLSDMYSNKGFAFVQVDPVTKINPADRNVDVALVITKGPPVYFNRVLVSGNTKTRDKVVRRELIANEQELYSGNKITQSKNALQRTGYFEDAQITTKKTDQADALDVLVEVKEGPTGTFQVGGGYSSGDGFIFNASVSEKNFAGRGQGVSGNFSIGSRRQDYVLSVTDPYFLDSKTALGIDAFNTTREYTDFEEDKIGFGINTSYPLKDFRMPFFGPSKREAEKGSDVLASNDQATIWDYMRGGVSYDLTHENIKGVSATAPPSIQSEKGKSLTSAVTPRISYDSRDHFFNPTEGTKSGFSVKTAGLGGDVRFIKSDVSGRWYYPLLKDPNWGGAYVLSLGGSVGYGLGLAERNNGQKDLPLFERYFLGGINSIRGFAERSIGPREPSGCSGNKKPEKVVCTGSDVVGGDKAMVFNSEILFPVYEQYGLRGVAFLDTGSSFNSFNFSDLRRSVGAGVRWMSPFGPLRVELGFPLAKKSGDETSVLGFSIGAQP
ncbi:MAG: outer membrane protein assembly complex, YaeT protein [Deltaproteobacteria bacterium]|nr:outer membrane protein assembly complex, YaeT protein [Deltaproteobacteria bacterium]